MKRLPAHRRLRDLPEVFTSTTLAATLGGDPKAASVYLARWRREGLITSLGPRTGVHFNLLRNPAAAEDLRMEAVAYVLPGAVIAGVSAVHAAGWTTQIPAATEIMAPSRRSFPEIDEVVIRPRGLHWLNLARTHLARTGVMPMVTPAFALADLWRSEDWRPDPDDIEWDVADLAAIAAAFSVFDIEVPPAWIEEACSAGLNGPA